jgi:hypothetical protein
VKKKIIKAFAITNQHENDDVGWWEMRMEKEILVGR